MNIVQVVSTYPLYKGGMGNVAAAIHEELLRRGHNSLVLTPEYGATEALEGIKRIPALLRFRNSAFVPGLYAHLNQADVIHLHYPFYGGAETVALYKRMHPKAKLVLTYHMDTVGRGGISLFFTLYQKLIQTKILRAGDVVTVSSLDYAAHSQLARVAGLNVVEWPFGVAADFLPKTELKLNDGLLHPLFVGGLDKAHYFKGLSVLLEAIAKTESTLRLTVVGSGDLLAAYQEEARLHGVADKVHFAGSLGKPDLIRAYQSADMTILPSIDASEAFGLVLLESMACQTPVIASDLPGVRTLARHEETGLIVPPKDAAALAKAIDRLADASLRHRLGAQAQAIAEQRYRWPALIDELIALYKGL